MMLMVTPLKKLAPMSMVSNAFILEHIVGDGMVPYGDSIFKGFTLPDGLIGTKHMLLFH